MSIVKLQDFEVSSETLSFDSKEVKNILPGKYIVLKEDLGEVTLDEEDQSKYSRGNLFIVHESFTPENIKNVNWEKGGVFSYDQDVIVLKDPNSKINNQVLKEKLSDEMANVIDNKVCFSLSFPENHYPFDVLKDKGQVIGFRVEEIGAWINTPQHLLMLSCIEGDLQKVKDLINETNPDKRAKLGYQSFYYACTGKHKDIISYFLTSSDIKEPFNIPSKEEKRFEIPFTILCNRNPEIVKELIAELPEKIVSDIKEFAKDSENLIKGKENFIQLLELREAKISKINSLGAPEESNVKKFKP